MADTELDELKAQLRQTQKQLSDAKGRIAAVELHSREIERDAKIATTQAETLKAETEAALGVAAEQMKMAHTISCAVYGMNQLSRSFMARKITSARIAFRDNELVDVLAAMCVATDKNDLTQLKVLADQAKNKVAVIKADGEMNRTKFHEHFIALGFTKFEETYESLLTAKG